MNSNIESVCFVDPLSLWLGCRGARCDASELRKAESSHKEQPQL